MVHSTPTLVFCEPYLYKGYMTGFWRISHFEGAGVGLIQPSRCSLVRSAVWSIVICERVEHRPEVVSEYCKLCSIDCVVYHGVLA